jgi:hypothetical protein
MQHACGRLRTLLLALFLTFSRSGLLFPRVGSSITVLSGYGMNRRNSVPGRVRAEIGSGACLMASGGYLATMA